MPKTKTKKVKPKKHEEVDVKIEELVVEDVVASPKVEVERPPRRKGDRTS